MIFLFNVSCSFMAVFSIDKTTNLFKGDIPADFKTGIIFYAYNEKPIKLNDIVTNIYSIAAPTFDTIVSAKWDYKTVIQLKPGKYIITTKVPYFGKDIWKSENNIEIKENQIREFHFKQTTWVFQKPKIEIF